MRVRVALLLLACAACTLAQLSKPIAPDNAEEIAKDNKYRNRDPVELENLVFGTDARGADGEMDCHTDVELLWTAEVGASIYATPLIADLHSDGVPDLIVPTFKHFVEVVELREGHKAPGWPYAFPQSVFHASPLRYDVNGDGVAEIVVVTENAEVVFFHEDGTPVMGETLRVPPLPVRKDWFEGIDDGHVDGNSGRRLLFENSDDWANKKAGKGVNSHGEQIERGEFAKAWRRQLQQANPGPKWAREEGAEVPQPWEVADDIIRGLKDEPTFDGFMGMLSQDARDSMDIFVPVDGAAAHLGEEGLQYTNPVLDSRHYLRYHSFQDFPENEPNHVYVDAHVLATPVIADLENNGGADLIIPVSYYFDREFYSMREHAHLLRPDVDIANYVAGGIVVFDLKTMNIKWETHLDLTTERTAFRAYVYSSPTVADIDGDHSFEVVVGTSVGFVYVLDKFGDLKDGFPVLMDEVQGQVAVIDVNSDGVMEIVAADNNANIVCFGPDGSEVWENRLSGFPSQGVVAGDVDGDGVLDVVVGSNAGHIWALSGDTGAYLPSFPIRTDGRILAPILLAPLREAGDTRSARVSIVVPSFDGFVYIVDGYDGCTDKIDLGETSFTQVLATDVTGNGKMDLIVTTMSGNIYALETGGDAHPLSTAHGQGHGFNGFTYRLNHQGIYVRESSRAPVGEVRDVSGSNILIHFTIVDERPPLSDEFRSYDVKIDMGPGTDVLFDETYLTAGPQSVNVPVPKHKLPAATIRVTMLNEQMQFFEDSFAVTFNRHFDKIIKWLVVLPFVAMGVTMAFIRDFVSPLPR